MISITKDEKIIKTALEVIEGIEDESISVSSSLLKCLKIARLLDDEEGMAWLQYEYSGYPTGNELTNNANAINNAISLLFFILVLHKNV